MMIMNQNKDAFITIENLYVYISEDYSEIIARNNNGCTIFLGEYKNEERCREVIQKIADWYERNKYYEVRHRESGNYNAVFYMPEE